jgi:hypothetical protein
MMELLAVAPDFVERFWPLVKDHVARSLVRCGGEDTVEHIKWKLLTARAQLWVIVENQNVIASGTTEILISNSGIRFLHVMTLGGRGLSAWQHLWGKIEIYARVERCQKIRFEGRPGWAKVLKDYRQPWRVFEKAL